MHYFNFHTSYFLTQMRKRKNLERLNKQTTHVESVKAEDGKTPTRNDGVVDQIDEPDAYFPSFFHLIWVTSGVLDSRRGQKEILVAINYPSGLLESK